MSKTGFQALRGMRDILPADTRRWQAVEDPTRATFEGYGFEELRLPLLEDTRLFKRGVGEATDIVEKEMFSFPSRDDAEAASDALKDSGADKPSLTLRPEGTACAVRSLQQHGLLYNQIQRVWYRGPMFRYERPQKGRYRQFEQIGAEIFGVAGPGAEAELIAMCADVFAQLGLLDVVELQLNTLGSGSARVAYREALVGYLAPHIDDLDEDSQRRLTTNPLRILDSKSSKTQEIIQKAPQLPDFVDSEAKAHFEQLRSLLDEIGIKYRLNSGLVRGLDYYTHTVFEWVTTALGAQGTVCAGGRYDGLVELLGGKPTPGAGFAMGVDRLVLLHEEVHQPNQGGPSQAFAPVDVYIAVADQAHLGFGLNLAIKLRHELSGVRIRCHISGGKLKSQMKKADGCGARFALIIGDQEVAESRITCKSLRSPTAETGEGQVTVAIAELAEHLKSQL